MGNLYLVRHGQASFGEADYDQLSSLGQKQSLRLGQYFAAKGLKFDAFITGNLRRHQQTLAGILQGLEHEAEPLLWPGLNEYDGEALIAAIHPDPLPHAGTPELVKQHFRLLRKGLHHWMAGKTEPLGMPSYVDFAAGIAGALDHVKAEHFGKNVLIVSSAGPIANAVGQVLEAPAQSIIELNMRIRNTALTEFSFTPKRHSLVTYNAVPHLDSAEHADWVTFV
ncbi:MAG: histidine phosphatase family protein [Pseudomonadota bacterium]